ncbi:MAG: hypothetical protein ACXWKC_09745 [Xanthobacteraceae bacterium]
MRGIVIIGVIVCALLAVDYYRFDGFYTDKTLEMGQRIVQGISR